MKSSKATLGILVAVLTVAIAAVAFAHGGSGGYGRGYRMGPGYRGQMMGPDYGGGHMMGPGYDGHRMGYSHGGHMMGPGYGNYRNGHGAWGHSSNRVPAPHSFDPRDRSPQRAYPNGHRRGYNSHFDDDYRH